MLYKYIKELKIMKVNLVHVVISQDKETVVDTMDFPNARTFRDRSIQAWVKQKANEYRDVQDDEDDYYEFRYEKLSRVEVPSGVWVVCQVEFLTDKL